MNARPTLEQVREWLAAVPDPEIPVVSVLDLGIVRELAWDGDILEVTVTPTYSGCPATEVIAADIRSALQARGLAAVHVATRLSPAWTTDWLSDAGREKLRAYGIAPPVGRAGEVHVPLSAIGRPRAPTQGVSCPRCGSHNTRETSRFGSTPCKALWRCADCGEPFDYFKCH
ncbi:1,2-phenylacetyl-CoA epoxidase subunit PaaD [Plasticicumulans acidivorans]|uniref:Ring-1,2-phenylacetyl-CoA epoxidase subunit PaaD n=1 Tax=Plasticicumulans acidivorans TaxID=886464 RepID=A0A317MU98_9GAMM|nr:1,2-phenylacetyl-CoA epoxidase subunit PaaD [Plasticicumulans acidivorans]PWV61224.1 ring-1,2-phenylacetyl-CoA epoxidase subunit PaaD [Plasticicumulans acidivorans]